MIPKYIDIHSHVNFKAFDEDRDEVIKRALEADTFVINVGTQLDTSRDAVELAHKYDEGVYAIIGLHPIHTGASYHDEKELGEGGKEFTSRGEVFDKNAYRDLLKDPKTVGIGECGLDYYRMDEESIEKQKKAFIAQIELANEINKPMMLHIRNNPTDKTHNAYADALELLKEHCKVKGDVHFFAGNWEVAKSFLDFGFTLSFTGVITFTKDYDEVIQSTPLDMIMTETDAPYVTPVPYRGKRNEPSYVREVVKKIALVKGLPEDEVAEAIIKNAKKSLWNLTRFNLAHAFSKARFTFLELSAIIESMQEEETSAENTAENIQNDSSMVEMEGNPSRVYEVGYLLVPTTPEEGVPALFGNLKESISKLDGEVISDEMPRMIQLAYTMLKVHKNVRNKYDTAYFGWVKFTMDSQKILELKKALDLDANVIRFLIIKTVKENTIAARRFMHREGGGTPHRRPVTKREEGEAPVEINKEEIDKEIDALVTV